jgi:ferrous iron transport protein A
MPLGCCGRIVSLPPGATRTWALRFGLAEGAGVCCTVRLPQGPVVIRRGQQEIAIGRDLARGIAVEICGAADS